MRLHLQGGGPFAVIMDLGTLKLDAATGEMSLASLNRGVTVDQVRERTPWDLRVAEPLGANPPPTERELIALRTLDPDRIYLG